MSQLIVSTITIPAGGLSDNSVTSSDIQDSAITSAKIADGGVTPSKLSGSQSGTAPIFGARAWVNFNGSNGVINASGNVSGVSRTGTGAYTITFTTAMPNANYALVAFGGNSNGTTGFYRISGSSQNPSNCSITVSNSGTTATDPPVVGLVVFG